jgi:hypothetical protein
VSRPGNPYGGTKLPVLAAGANKQMKEKVNIEMKIKHCLMLVAVLAAVAGCKPSDQPAPDKPVTGQDVKQQYKDALNTTKDYAVQSKDEFLAAAGEKMKALDTKIDELSRKSAELKDDAKVQADKALADLRAQREAAGRKYDELKQSSNDAWDKTKTAFSNALDNLEKTYHDVRSKFD